MGRGHDDRFVVVEQSGVEPQGVAGHEVVAAPEEQVLVCAVRVGTGSFEAAGIGVGLGDRVADLDALAEQGRIRSSGSNGRPLSMPIVLSGPSW